MQPLVLLEANDVQQSQIPEVVNPTSLDLQKEVFQSDGELDASPLSCTQVELDEKFLNHSDAPSFTECTL